MSRIGRRVVIVFLVVLVPIIARGQTGDGPDLADIQQGSSEMRDAVERFRDDLGNLRRFYAVQLSATRDAQLTGFYRDWLSILKQLDFDRMTQTGKIDYILLRNHLERELRRIEIEAGYRVEAGPLIPFAETIIALEETRRRMEPVKPAEAAQQLTQMVKQIEELRKKLDAGLKAKGMPAATTNADPKLQATADVPLAAPEADAEAAPPDMPQPEKEKAVVEALIVKRTVANRAAGMVRSLRTTLTEWNTFYSGYDPVFSWWMTEPFKAADDALEGYAKYLREKVVGIPEDDKTTIVGDPIGSDALLTELAFEMIPYTPEELVALANREFAWCEAEMKQASNEMGFGDDWKAALEHVKTLHVEPGAQPQIVRKLALEAIKFLDDHDLVTVPPLCRDTWRMEMLTARQQLMSPFFLGGEVIQVAFPTDAMTHEQKLMSMRGNNIHFARATVHHELIPGHHLQGFMTSRYKPWRSAFGTPFWLEGWALYWEMLLYDLDFPKSPENRVGMLFWRMHRCARIIFSLSFHLEKMTPEECVNFLVDRVGHERENAAAEVRRSFEGNYGPLYQAAYMLGGLQIRALHRELVDSGGAGRMTNRQFHDAILRENSMPIEMVRAALINQPLTRDFKSSWKFYGEPPE